MLQNQETELAGGQADAYMEHTQYMAGQSPLLDLDTPHSQLPVIDFGLCLCELLWHRNTSCRTMLRLTQSRWS